MLSSIQCFNIQAHKAQLRCNPSDLAQSMLMLQLFNATSAVVALDKQQDAFQGILRAQHVSMEDIIPWNAFPDEHESRAHNQY